MKASDFKMKHPKCCFCGGTVNATTIEHQPAKIIFPDKHRPKGLEFPSCASCNKQTAPDEVLVALMARIGGSLRDERAGLDTKLEDVISSVCCYWPKLLSEIKPHDASGETSDIDVTHPQISESLCRVSAKAALATYYSETNNIACEKSIIETKWTQNQLGCNAASVHLSNLLPNNASLTQGKWNTTSTFYLKFFIQERFLYQIVTLHESISLIAKLSIGGPPEEWRPAMKRWFPSPGVGIRKYCASRHS